MRILWITNRPIAAAERKYNVKATSGTWMEPALDALKSKSDVDIFIATVAACKGIEKFCEDSVTYYCLPSSKKVIYPHSSKKNLALWDKVIKEIKPDLIMVWGTEYAHGYCALKAAGNIPSVIYTQGILDSIDRYYLADMTPKELRYAVTFRNILKRDTIRMQQRLYRKKAKIEKEMLCLSNNIIVESDWVRLWCERIALECKTYNSEISIGNVFFEKQWKEENCNKHTIFTSATGNYPLKGLHILLKAMPLILKEYPDAVLRVPATADPFNASVFSRFKRTGYIKYLMKLIKENNLRDNVQFLGRLTSEEMAEEMQNANVFVVSSSIENLSTTLREAMTVGTPSVVSHVGGLPEIAINGKTSLNCRFGEYEVFADKIVQLLSNDIFAEKLSEDAQENIMKSHNPERKREILYQIYKEILQGEDKE